MCVLILVGQSLYLLEMSLHVPAYILEIAQTALSFKNRREQNAIFREETNYWESALDYEKISEEIHIAILDAEFKARKAGLPTTFG
jgi:hypothetical protein